MITVFVAILLCLVTCNWSSPVDVIRAGSINLNEFPSDNGTEIDLVPYPANISEILLEAVIQRLRQDEGDTGFEAGANVAEIITGVLGGGLGNIFEGSSNFIGNSAVQEEVQFVLRNVSPAFDVLLKYGWDGLKQYFKIGVTTPKPVQVVQQPIIINNGTVQNGQLNEPSQNVQTSEPIQNNQFNQPLEIGQVHQSVEIGQANQPVQNGQVTRPMRVFHRPIQGLPENVVPTIASSPITGDNDPDTDPENVNI